MNATEGQIGKEKIKFRPEIINDARKAAEDLFANFEARRNDKTKAAILDTIAAFEDVITKIPNIFAASKSYLSAGIRDFEEKDVMELRPLEDSLTISDHQLQTTKRELDFQEATMQKSIADLDTELEKLKAETTRLGDIYTSLKDEYEKLSNGEVGFLEILKNLRPGRKKAIIESKRSEASAAFEAHQAYKTKLRAKQSAAHRLSSNLGDEKYRLNRKVNDQQQNFAQAKEKFLRKIEEINRLLSAWISRLQEEIEKCAKGHNLNQADIIEIDVRARVNGVVGMASEEVDHFPGEFSHLAGYNTSMTGLDPISQDPGAKNQNSFEYFSDTSISTAPVLFYTGQILETGRNSVSRRFVSCTLVEVFSPTSNRHVAFHLPPTWIKEAGQSKTAHFLEYNPLFFYQNLTRFIEREGCDFADLEIKIISGVNVPPDQLASSLESIGCEKNKINIFQLPTTDFSTLTLAKSRKVLVMGEEVQFLEPGQSTREKVYSTVGGNSGRGHRYHTTNSETRYVV